MDEVNLSQWLSTYIYCLEFAHLLSQSSCSKSQSGAYKIYELCYYPLISDLVYLRALMRIKHNLDV